MDSKALRKELEKRLKSENRLFTFDREKDVLRIEDKETRKGVNVSLPPILGRWEIMKEKAIDEVVYYVNEALAVMGKEPSLSEREKYIYPVIRSTSFPKEAKEGVPFLYDDHTAETRIYYALDMGTTYRLIDKELLEKENWDARRVRETAKFNARSLSTSVKKDEVADNVFYFLNTNDGYDSSRILNEKWLSEMEEKVEGVMTVSVPHADVLIIGDIRNETGYDILANMTMSFFANGRIPITALSFLYENGKLEPIFILAKNKRK